MIAQLSHSDPRGRPSCSSMGVRWAGSLARNSGVVVWPQTSTSSKSSPAARTKTLAVRLLTLGLRMLRLFSAMRRVSHVTARWPTPSARTPPRRPSSPPRASSSRARCSWGSPRRTDRPARPRCAARAASAFSTSRSSSAARLIAFLDGPAGSRAAVSLAFAPPFASRPPRFARPRGARRRLAALLADARVLGPAAQVAPDRAVLDRERARAHRVQQRAVVRDRAGRAVEPAAARPRAPRARRCPGGWWARPGSARSPPTPPGSPATAAGARRPTARRAASPPRRR